MGTMVQQRHLTADDSAARQKAVTSTWSRPARCLDIHRAYLEAGADIIETDTFGGAPLVLAEYDLADRAGELNRTAAQLARQAAAEFSTPDKPRFVAGSMGPTTKAISVTGGITFRELEENFYQQASALAEGGADILLVETCQDTQRQSALLAIERPTANSAAISPSCSPEPWSPWAPCSPGKRPTPSGPPPPTWICSPLA
jgi:5-methyltetrahydrofolate--homocysteine methyltransferase